MKEPVDPKRTLNYQFINSVGTLATGIGTLIFVIVLMVQINDTKDQFEDFKSERRLAKMEERHREFFSPQMMYHRSLAAADPKRWGQHTVPIYQFFEKLARDYTHEVIALEDVDHYFGTIIPAYWCNWKAEVIRTRQKWGDPTVWTAFERLFSDLPENQCPSHADIENTLKAETKILETYQQFLDSVYRSTTEAFLVEQPQQ